MTAQDWLPELAEDEEQAETPSLRRRRWILAGAAALAILVALAGAVAALYGHAAPRPAPSTAAAVPSSAPTPPAAAEDAPVVIRADLSDPAVHPGGDLAPLIVGIGALQGGSAPARVPNFDSCSADAATVQYLPVQIREPDSWLSATVTVQTTASTPSGIGRLGFFFQAGNSSIPCPAGAWSTSDSFLASTMGQWLITGYVVLDRAYTPSTPQGRADVFRTLQLRVSNIRSSGRPVAIGAPTVGALCPGSSDALCVPPD